MVYFVVELLVSPLDVLLVRDDSLRLWIQICDCPQALGNVLTEERLGGGPMLVTDLSLAS